MFKRDESIKLFEAFAGIGMQKIGLEKLGLEVENVGISEIDRHALVGYALSHYDYDRDVEFRYAIPYIDNEEYILNYLKDKNIGFDYVKNKHTLSKRTNKTHLKDLYISTLLSNNYGDISKINGSDLPDEIDIFTYSFPCQDLSKIGTRKGMEKGTRSGLVFEVLRIAKERNEINKPIKMYVMENVKTILGKKNIESFKLLIDEWSSLGYDSYVMEVQGDDFNVPQLRPRVFMVSVPKGTPYELPLKLSNKEVYHKITLSDLLDNINYEDFDENITHFRPYNKQTFEEGLLSFKPFVNMVRALRVDLTPNYLQDSSKTLTTRYLGGGATEQHRIDVVDKEGPYLDENFVWSSYRLKLVTKADGSSFTTQKELQDYIINVDEEERNRIKKQFIDNLDVSYDEEYGLVYFHLEGIKHYIRKLNIVEGALIMAYPLENIQRISKYVPRTEIGKQLGNGLISNIFGILVNQALDEPLPLYEHDYIIY